MANVISTTTQSNEYAMRVSYPKQFNQLNTPLLNSMEDETTVSMLRQKQQQHRPNNSCDDDDENDNVNNSDGLYRVIHEQQNQIPILTNEENDQPCENSYDDDILWYQQPQQISAMISNFSTSYNAVNVSLVLPILKVALRHNSLLKHDGDVVEDFSLSSEQQQQTPSSAEDAEGVVASSLLAGMMIGQILGGVLGDIVGPSLALRLVMFLQVIASIGSSCSAVMQSSSSQTSSFTIYWHLAAWRFLLGIGAGGVYPLAAVLSASQKSEQPENDNCQAQKRHSSTLCDPDTDEYHGDKGSSKLHRVVLTFSTQGLGFITVPLVAVMLLHLFPNNLNIVWRLILGFGCIPGLFLMGLQWRSSKTMLNIQSLPQEREVLNSPLTDTTTAQLQLHTSHEVANDGQSNKAVLHAAPDSDVEHDDIAGPQLPGPNVVRESSDSQSLWESIWKEENLARKLLGTAATWFLFDVLFYGNTLFQPIVMTAAFGATENGDPIRLLQRTARNSLAITSIALPGYIIASLVLGKRSVWCYCGIEQTPRFVMMQGFAVMAILYFTIGSAWDTLRRFPSVLVILYSLTFFFANYGPNTTTFVLPSLVFSEECRSTLNGLSAAAGKLGALTGATLFEPASDRLGNASVMLICSSISVVALVLTKCFVPSAMSHSITVQHHNHIHTRISDVEVL